jgi:26S proteasome regulatory subunit N7
VRNYSQPSEILERPKGVGSSLRIDIYFSLLRLSLAYDVKTDVMAYVEKTSAAVEKEGDWEKRNKLKIYEGLYWCVSCVCVCAY